MPHTIRLLSSVSDNISKRSPAVTDLCCPRLGLVLGFLPRGEVAGYLSTQGRDNKLPYRVTTTNSYIITSYLSDSDNVDDTTPFAGHQYSFEPGFLEDELLEYEEEKGAKHQAEEVEAAAASSLRSQETAGVVILCPLRKNVRAVSRGIRRCLILVVCGCRTVTFFFVHNNSLCHHISGFPPVDQLSSTGDILSCSQNKPEATAKTRGRM